MKDTVIKLKLLAFHIFMRANPSILVIILAISFFSDKDALKCLKIEHWIFAITFICAIPQLITNFKTNNR